MRSIAIFSLKGGVGKTTAAVNLAHAAATAGGRRTLLWDLDSQAAATLLLRSQPGLRTKARAALAGDQPLAALVEPTQFANLSLLPADRSLRRLEGDLARADRGGVIRRHLKALAPRFDRILIDSPPGRSTLADELFRAVDLLVVPSIPAPLSAAAEAALADELDRLGKAAPPLLLFWNMADRRRLLHRTLLDSHPDRLAIPSAAAVEAMTARQAPLGAFAPQSPVARSFAQLWSAVEMALLKS
ncbi:ParA family protein [Thermaurantiacus sp.]